MTTPIRLLLSDVDGTLVTPDKELTERAILAVGRLHDAGIAFAVTSGRPPLGMSMLIDPLELRTPLAAFNGGLIVDREMAALEQRIIPADQVQPIIAQVRDAGLEVWVYQGPDWFVLDLDGSHVAREAWTVAFSPTQLGSFEDVSHDVVKIVGVSDDYELVAATTISVHDRFGDHVSASRSQPYYLDITHPDANKGGVVQFLSRHLDIPTEAIATIGDMPNDVLMFAHCGLSVAMGNADREVQRAARRVTSGNDDEGFANAVERFILP
jgi:Cof subfamily protein (haloacid dehalogenase superfamily)